MRVVKLAPGARGVDTVLTLDAPRCAALVAEAVRFVVRYVDGLTPAEVATILDAGLALLFVTYAKSYDGQRTVGRLRSLGVPEGATVALDVEDCGEPAPAVIRRVNAWATTVKAGGYIPAIYVGAGCPLTSDELWDLAVQRYWHSCSRVVDAAGNEAAPKCGWGLYQLSPPNAMVGGVVVDLNFAQNDHHGRAFTAVVAD